MGFGERAWVYQYPKSMYHIEQWPFSFLSTATGFGPVYHLLLRSERAYTQSIHCRCLYGIMLSMNQVLEGPCTPKASILNPNRASNPRLSKHRIHCRFDPNSESYPPKYVKQWSKTDKKSQRCHYSTSL